LTKAEVSISCRKKVSKYPAHLKNLKGWTMNTMRTKYPRIPHLTWSPGRSEDDIALDSIEHLEQLKDVVVTEKLDGENTTLYHDYLHARSVDSKSHPSRNTLLSPLKGGLSQFHAKIRYDIPEDFRSCDKISEFSLTILGDTDI
jgi:hypothetical protein